jgi:sentrin-specific protease 1
MRTQEHEDPSAKKGTNIFAAPPEVLLELRKSLVDSSKPRLLDIAGPLVDEIDLLLDWGFYGDKESPPNDNAIVSKMRVEQIQISRGQFRTLMGGQWMEDTVIDFYLTLLQRRESSAHYQGYRCHFFSAFFYSSLMCFEEKKYNFPSVLSWMDSYKYSILSVDKIFIPVCVNCVHWALVVVHVPEKKIEYLDSMTYQGKEIMHNIARCLDDYAKHNHLITLDVNNQFEKFCLPNNPRQTDSFSCGVFVLAFADYLALGWELTFSQVEIDKYRKKNCPGDFDWIGVSLEKKLFLMQST